MNRRTITLPEPLAEEIEAAVAGGAAPNVSRFFHDAARCYLAELRARRLLAEAEVLDRSEEVALARGEPAAAPWGRLA